MKNLKKIVLIFALIVFNSALFAENTKPDAVKLYRDGNYKEAIEICEAEIAENPKNLDSYCVMCWCLLANRQYAEAEQTATEARKINSYDVRFLELLGEAKYFLGKNNDALSLFQRYIANVPENADRIDSVYYYMGEIYVKQEKYEHADISFSMAVRLKPQKDYWWSRLGYAKEMSGDWRGAMIAYEKALELNPTQSDAINGKNRCQSRI